MEPVPVAMEPVAGLPPAIGNVAEVVEKLEALATSQTRMEGLLAAIRQDLSSLALPPKLSDTQSCAEEPYAAEEPDAAPEQDASESGRVVAHDGEEWTVPPSLPCDWPASVEVREVPRRLGSKLPSQSNPTSSRMVKYTVVMAARMENTQISVRTGTSCLRMAMVHPSSTFHGVYSILSLVVLLHDLLVIPYRLAWNLSAQGVFLWAAWMSCAFWTLDVGVNCITGFHVAGYLEMRPSYVVRAYARSWMALDVVIVLSDWMGLLLGALPVWKLLRLVGLLRMMRVVRIMEEFAESSLSEFARTLQRCFLVFCGMFWVIHLIGCAWFALGRLAMSDTGMRWTDTEHKWGGEDVMFTEHSILHQYITSLHWSMAQFTLGAMDIPACNSIERAFNIMCMALGLFFGSTLVSMLSASMVDYQMTWRDQNQKLSRLRCFLRHNSITRDLATLVQEQVKERLSSQVKIQEDDVVALRLLAPNVRRSLRYELFRGHLCQHAFFRLWLDLDHQLACQLCMDAMESTLFRTHDDVFSPGDMADKAYNLLSGQMIYVQEPMTAPVDQTMVTHVLEDRWFCEAALWAQWIHVGAATARAPCQALLSPDLPWPHLHCPDLSPVARTTSAETRLSIKSPLKRTRNSCASSRATPPFNGSDFLATTTLYRLQNANSTVIYGWVTPSRFQQLKTQGGDSDLRHGLALLSEPGLDELTI